VEHSAAAANNALQPTVGAATVRANRRGLELAPPSAERERYADLKNSNKE